MADEMVKVKIRPLHGIGGYGEAGDVVTMRRELAEMYERDGYVEFVDPPAADAASPQMREEHPNLGGEKAPAQEEHAIMKPEAKRAKGARGKKK